MPFEDLLFGGGQTELDILERGARIQEQIERGEYVAGRPLREVLAERASTLGVELDL
ncbi:hypothetical protein [Microbispora bryophytorum]|uniref:hypothetical protein n=1 Tax=Microbispora bryophytorum TaxID=1460882 RepID=UPI0033DEB06F